MSPEERVLAEVDRWVPRFLAGKARDLALLGPKLRPGERFGVKLLGVGVSRVSAHDPLRDIDTGKEVLGLAYGTSERLLVANLGRVKREWEWSRLDDVSLLPGYSVVVLRPDAPDAQVEAVHRVRIPPDLFAQKPHVVAARWLCLEGCFAAARGELQQWRAGLPARVRG